MADNNNETPRVVNVPLGGITRRPSDHDNPDGDLALAYNLIPEDNALKQLPQPGVKFKLETDQNLMCLHRTPDYTHYIIFDGSNNEFNFDALMWIDDADKGKKHYFPDDRGQAWMTSNTVHKIIPVGNTLIVLTNAGLRFWLWRATDYQYLGEQIPRIPLNFFLERPAATSGRTELETFQERDEAKVEKINKNLTALLGLFNKQVADAAAINTFTQPFLLRYAIKLYDGTYINLSPPLLMVPANKRNPTAYFTESGRGTVGSKALVSTRTFALCCCGYSIAKSVIDTLAQSWSDIVDGVGVFLSSPIYTYDQAFTYVAGQAGGYGYDINGKDTIVHGSLYKRSSARDEPGYMAWVNNTSLSVSTADKTDYVFGSCAERTDAEIAKDITEVSQFYLVKYYTVGELSGILSKSDGVNPVTWKLDMDKGTLSSLEAREALKDETASLRPLVASSAYELNGRLSLFDNVSEMLFDGYTPEEMMAADRITEGEDRTPDTLQITVALYKDGRTIYVRSDATANYMERTDQLGNRLLYVYYPDPDAKAAYIRMKGQSTEYYKVPLTRHEHLNGAYFFGGWDGATSAAYRHGDTPPDESAAADRTLSLHGQVVSSALNNPFYYPDSGRNVVGTGRVLGLSSTVKALSQGQFGQFPLYAFTTDGIWAMRTDSAGNYQTVQPVSRDVCNNPDSITQIDDAVLFTTDRGIMMIAGSETRLISDPLQGTNLSSPLSMPKADKLAEIAGLAQISDNDKQALTDWNYSLLANCQMIYDYVHQRIIVYTPSNEDQHTFAYVYSLRSKQWGMMYCDIDHTVNAYPTALAQRQDGAIVDYAIPYNETVDDTTKPFTHGLAITRPIHLGDPDTLKTIRDIYIRGYYNNGQVQTALYGTRNLRDWLLVSSSVDGRLTGFSGTPYKAYRLAIITTLDPTASISYATIQFLPRMLNRLR